MMRRWLGERWARPTNDVSDRFGKTGEPAVLVERVSVVYRRKAAVVNAVHEVSLRIEQGQFAALCGPSGSGKTSLLQTIGCLRPPDHGSIFIDGQDVGRLGEKGRTRLRARSIGFVFQSFDLVPVLTAQENVELALIACGVRHADRRRVALEGLARVGLLGLEDRRPNELSGGQCQRVAIARALAARPSLVLADEPTANLDHATAMEILGLMRTLNQSLATTFLISTHDPRVVDMVRRVIRMNDGRVEADNGDNQSRLSKRLTT